MKKKKGNLAACSFCRFMRALAFSAIGAAAGGLSAKWLGADQQTIIMSALLGSIGLVSWVNRKRGK